MKAFLPMLVLVSFCAGLPARAAAPDGPKYTADGQLLFPADYREWVFLSSGLNMSYNPTPQEPSHPMFNNVFVNPSAYRAFRKTGLWPEGTLLVLENRGGETGHSINTRGTTQSGEIMGLEVHVKDAKGPQAGWGFFSFDTPTSAKLLSKTEDCYSCHQAHAAVDTTFVQFYPTLFGLAREKATLSTGFLGDEQAPPAR